MKTKHIIIFVSVFAAIYLFGQNYRPNKFTAKEYKPSGLPGHADAFMDSIKEYTRKETEAMEGIDVELSLKMALSMRDFEEMHPQEFKEITKETNSIELARKLKTSSNFKKIAKERELDLSKVYYVSN
jgi:hypothetical protein